MAVTKRGRARMKWSWKEWRVGALVLACFAVVAPAVAQETVCARVKIEIKQELTLERVAVKGNPAHG